MLRLDHLAVTAERLEDGVAAVEAALGVSLAGGGQHPHMATHNRLLGLGDIYLEVIAPDPAAPPPAWPRWFDMDRFSGPPRLTNWIVASGDIAADLALAAPGTGTPVALSRGDCRWQMAVPADGRLPFDNAHPALIQWHGPLHPARALPDLGVRLARLEVAHPDAAALTSALARFSDPRVVIVPGAEKAMRATFTTPHGMRRL
ncbi:MAG: VOC family protein [Tabrizicola sp.]|uniref:VOC family protein n=1 Tax=Tabrizicola sp. TaxID=2005166 RepID=UPI002736DAA8|nr:VOC family protein [Tabrizicola sp.]MDP3263671.1 VOC family protein [Tabrizicola sp.]MDP3647035.1 VOC family protein [Paracoccaceae bacterium]MDZ4069879.1 VOC family protein [Tabrizicola sp.]